MKKKKKKPPCWFIRIRWKCSMIGPVKAEWKKNMDSYNYMYKGDCFYGIDKPPKTVKIIEGEAVTDIAFPSKELAMVFKKGMEFLWTDVMMALEYMEKGK